MRYWCLHRSLFELYDFLQLRQLLDHDHTVVGPLVRLPDEGSEGCVQQHSSLVNIPTRYRDKEEHEIKHKS